MRKITLLFAALIITCGLTQAQEDIAYQKPPKEILELADAPQTPSVLIDDKNENIVLLHRNKFLSIAELSETELRLAGLRINPVTNTESRANYITKITLMKVGNKQEIAVSGLPAEPQMSNFTWSPDQTKMAFTHTVSTGAELWMLDIATATCQKITDANLNANIGRPFYWFADSKNLLVKFLPGNRKALIDKTLTIPTGPNISVSDGKKAQNRTYQDLLKDNADEQNFEQLAQSTLYKVSIDGEKSLWKETGMYTRCNFSPSGEYVLVSTLNKPFSYLVTYNSFPSKTTVYNKDGKEVKVILESPLIEDLPQGFMATVKGKRNINWRSDKPATLYYAEALDEGDPAKEVEFRDEVFELSAPFTGEPRSVIKTIQRYSGITWGNDEIAIASDRWWNTRNSKTYIFNPSNSSVKPIILFDLNYQDNYSDPGLSKLLTRKKELY